ncbi:MAG: HAMP domain-containing protein, partial [Marinobacter sp.]
MRRWGIRKKVLVVTLVPTLITTVLLGLFFTWSWVNNINQLLDDRGDSLSRQLAAAAEYGMFTANRSLLSSLSNALLEEQDVRSITFYNARRERLLHAGPASASEKPDQFPNGSTVSRVPSSGTTAFISPIFLQDLMLENLLDLESRATAPSAMEPIGWALVEMSHVRTEKETWKALFISLLVIVAGVLLSLAIALRLSRSFTDPVFELNRAVARLKEGHLDTRVHTGAGPEFEQLESGLNAMAGELSKAQ